jgi:hypothetical protein
MDESFPLQVGKFLLRLGRQETFHSRSIDSFANI